VDGRGAYFDIPPPTEHVTAGENFLKREIEKRREKRKKKRKEVKR
jgi:hypothetical protein